MNKEKNEQLLLEIREVIRVRRKMYRYTLTELANKTGLSKNFISDFELGKTNITISKFITLCYALNCWEEVNLCILTIMKE